MDEHLDVNRSLWDRLAEAHTAGATAGGFYDVEGFLAGRTALREIVLAEMEAAVGSVAGLDLLHLQCHFGLDTLSWARLGASVTGVDFSAVAVARARELASRAGLGLEATFVQADAQRLPADLDGRFDVVFASYGVLCWISDLDAWFGGAYRTLRSGGTLLLVELHPLMYMVDSTEPVVFGTPYLGGAPVVDQWEGTYADGEVEISQPSIDYPHGVGEIITAAVRAGFGVSSFNEYLREDKEGRPGVLSQDENGKYRLVIGGQELPITYALRATKP